MTRTAAMLVFTAASLATPAALYAGSPYDALIAQHAAANGVPVSLVHRVILRESRYNPHAVHAGNYGMMQIRLQTARGMGYTGSAQGLLDPNTNLTYAVKYLAGAYRAAGGNQNRAVAYYAGGYYYAAKRQGLIAPRGARASTAIAPTFVLFNQPAAGTSRHRRATTTGSTFTLFKDTSRPTSRHRVASANPFANWLTPHKVQSARHARRSRTTSM